MSDVAAETVVDGRRSPGAARALGTGTAFRFALRELRGGLRGFWVFIACIALGVMAIAGVNSLSRAMTETIAEQGQVILGGDIAFELLQREASADEAGSFSGLGSVSKIATLRAMARKADAAEQTLVEVKAIDAAYPLYGAVEVEGGGDAQALTAAGADGRFGGLVEEALLIRLGLKVGDSISVGAAQFAITGIIRSEPDKVAAGLGFGPRLLISEAALRATELVQPGSLVRWTYRVRLADGAPSPARLAAITADANKRFPEAGWEIRSRDNAAPGLRRNIERFAQFLTLVGLTALIVGGVGVANAIRAFLDGKRNVIATLKCLGASGGFVFRVYAIQIGVLAGIGVGIGLVAGALASWAGAGLLAGVLPIGPRATLYPSELALATVYGFLTAGAFALWPLGRAHDIRPTALFRDSVEPSRRWPRPVYLLAMAAIVAALSILSVLLSGDYRIALSYLGAVAGAFVALRLVASGIMALAKRAPHIGSTELRLAIANIHRPGALTPSVVLSLGLGLALFVALALVDFNLRSQLTSQLPRAAPSFFFLDVPNRDLQGFTAFLADAAPDAKIEQVPMLRGRIVAVGGVRAEDLKPAAGIAWVLNGDRGVTYADSVPPNSKVVAGAWWAADYAGPPLVSLAADVGEGLGLKVGDAIRVNVLGREIEAKVANFRTLQWDTLSINFVMVFSPNTFRGAPHGHLATVAWAGGGTPAQEIGLLRAVTGRYPTVTSVRVKEALKAVNDLVGQLADGIAVAAGVTLLTSILVLAGALASGQHARIRDAVILKTLGATRRRLILAFGLEYALLGLATALFGLIAGTVGAWLVIDKLMHIGFAFAPFVAFGALAAALVATLVFGLAGTWSALAKKPAEMLRTL